MPPFKKGFLKRKVETEKLSEDTGNVEESAGSGSEAELDGVLGADSGDDTDSDGELEDSHSDHEKDEVLYQSDEDSDFQGDSSSDKSSELEDSEDDSNSEKGNTSEDESSDGESGLGQTPSSEDGEPPEATRTSRRKLKPNTDISKAEKSLAVIGRGVLAPPSDQRDEYSSGDTSDEEDRVNTTGAVPLWWYDEYEHVGYDLDGRRLMRPPRRDAVDEFLRRCEDPDYWRTVRDPATGQDVRLSAADLELLRRLRAGHLPADAPDEYAPWLEWFSREPLATPLRAFPEHKRSFLPSRDTQLRISRLVHALNMGWIKTRKQLAEERRARKERRFYDLWGGDSEQRRAHRPLPAPRRPPPTHAESYNPPPEYLLDAKEMKEWDKLAETPWRRKYTFLPTRHDSLRAVPAYDRFIRERFLRCLDLYLAPRAIKMRLTISPEDLVPKLPAPRDLQPFPTAEALAFKGHDGPVRSCDFDPSGQFALSGGEDGSLRVWEVATGRCLRVMQLGESVVAVAWSPVRSLPLVAAAVGSRLLLLSPGPPATPAAAAAAADALLQTPPPAGSAPDSRTSAAASWPAVAAADWARGVRLQVTHFRPVRSISWQARGDYVCVTLEDAAARAVIVHQLSRRRSQLPFSRAKGRVQTAVFHPTRPFLFVATQRAVRVYDLVKQELVKKLQPGVQWVSCVAPHPAGDNVLVGSFDRRAVWFDLDLSARPYQALRLHGGAVRAVAFHRRYPLFATAGDDPYAVVSHGMVYNDLLQNPLLVPLKQLRAGAVSGGLCSLDARWHPAQPWLLLAGADSMLRLYA